jgi:hypothetical protein
MTLAEAARRGEDRDEPVSRCVVASILEPQPGPVLGPLGPMVKHARKI